MKHFLLFLSAFTFSVASAMDVTEVISKMQQVYKKADNFSYTAEYKLYSGPENTVTSSFSGVFQCQGTNAYQKIGQSEYVSSESYSLQVDHESKLMSLNKGNSYIRPDASISNSLKECDKVEMETNGDNYVITLYVKISSGIPYSKVQISVDKKHFFLRSINLFYAGVVPSHLEIQLSKPDMHPGSLEFTKLYSKYITKEEGKFSATAEFTDYILINQLD